MQDLHLHLHGIGSLSNSVRNCPAAAWGLRLLPPYPTLHIHYNIVPHDCQIGGAACMGEVEGKAEGVKRF